MDYRSNQARCMLPVYLGSNLNLGRVCVELLCVVGGLRGSAWCGSLRIKLLLRESKCDHIDREYWRKTSLCDVQIGDCRDPGRRL